MIWLVLLWWAMGFALYMPIIYADYRSNPEQWEPMHNVAAVLAIGLWPVGLAVGAYMRVKDRSK
jgi:hypothetical protein